MTFEEFTERWTGRDMAYHERNGTVGIDFARAAWEEATQQERERCAKICKDSERYRGEYFAAKILEMK